MRRLRGAYTVQDIELFSTRMFYIVALQALYTFWVFVFAYTHKIPQKVLRKLPTLPHSFVTIIKRRYRSKYYVSTF
jgi:hypothetical protein